MPKETKSKPIVNKVKAWCATRDWDRQRFLARCLDSRVQIDGKELSVDTILRVYDGDTGINLTTVALIGNAVGVGSIAELFDFD